MHDVSFLRSGKGRKDYLARIERLDSEFARNALRLAQLWGQYWTDDDGTAVHLSTERAGFLARSLLAALTELDDARIQLETARISLKNALLAREDAEERAHRAEAHVGQMQAVVEAARKMDDAS